MRITIIFLLLVSCLSDGKVHAQKQLRSFGQYIVTDSASTLMIPTTYNVPLFTSDKMAGSGEAYANILFYNFTTDSIKKLFDSDTYIASLTPYGYALGRATPAKSMSSKYIFYRCYSVDRNKNGKIDHHDPAVLYVSDRYGNNLTALTTQDQNVVSFEIFDKQNFLLVMIQRDTDKDGSFEMDTDRDFYYVKLDLETKQFGRKIEAR
jgi:hypothetical protein